MKLERFVKYNLSDESKGYLVSLDAFNTGRSFLGKGGFVVLGSSGMRAGDLVCVIHGWPFPFVLRELEGSAVMAFGLVGGVYCDGIMNSEALAVRFPELEFRLL